MPNQNESPSASAPPSTIVTIAVTVAIIGSVTLSIALPCTAVASLCLGVS